MCPGLYERREAVILLRGVTPPNPSRDTQQSALRFEAADPCLAP